MFILNSIAVYSNRMKRQLIYIAAFLMVVFSGCRNISERFAKTGEGMIVYNVTYPDGKKYGMKELFFPKTITLVFKDEQAAFIATGGMGMVQLVNLLDHKTLSYTSLLIDHLRGNFACKLVPAEIIENESKPVYEFEPMNEFKTVAGIECRKAVVKDASGQSSFDVYYDSKIKFYYWNSPFKDFNHLMLEYTHTVNNLKMKLEAVKVDLTTPVDTSLFHVKGDYKRVNQKEFFAHINEL